MSLLLALAGAVPDAAPDPDDASGGGGAGGKSARRSKVALQRGIEEAERRRKINIAVAHMIVALVASGELD